MYIPCFLENALTLCVITSDGESTENPGYIFSSPESYYESCVMHEEPARVTLPLRVSLHNQKHLHRDFYGEITRLPINACCKGKQRGPLIVLP